MSDPAGAGMPRTTIAVLAASSFVLGAIVVAVIWAATSGGRSPEPAVTSGGWTEEPTTTPAPAESPGGAVAGCPEGTVVATADALRDALAAAAPGDVIQLAPGRYAGEFRMTASGTPERPITLCGGPQSVLDGGGIDGGYVVHLDHATHWRLVGFAVTNGQKGVMADGTVGSVIQGLIVTRIGDEAIHLRNFSTDNLVTGNVVDTTGLRREKFGEGIYIGTAESNWCDITGCQPDRSDRNVVEGNTIRNTTAEAIDVKEGTTGGVVRGNTFDGSAITDDGADSWVDIKGNEWLIEGNSGVNSPLDGFQTHEILDGWGNRNVFRGNAAVVNGPGFGFSLTPARDNVVTCDNTASGAGEGVSNVRCTTG
jgi:hypothetical protein